MNEVLQKLEETGIVPVIALDDAEKAVPLAKALVAGGLSVAEITFRTAAAAEAIRRIAAQAPEMLVGAGTVLTKAQVDSAAAAGARFQVSPGFHPQIVRYALERGIDFMPGAATPGEMEQAMSLGLSCVKFFPAEQNGGLPKLKALAGPYPGLRWMPTGGIGVHNLAAYLRFERVVACGGTWMVKKELIEAENWAEITRLSQEAVETMFGFRIAQITLRCGDAGEAAAASERLGILSGGLSKVLPPAKDGTIVFLADRQSGACGSITIATNTISRAAAYFRRRGVALHEESDSGQTVFRQEIAGFDLRLVQEYRF